MADVPRAPRIWIDVEQGAAFGDPAATLAAYRQLTAVTADVREVWLFADDVGPLIRGFRYPRSLHERFGVPHGLGPRMVLIDERGDHLWFSGASCGAGESAAAAVTILTELGIGDAVAPAGAVPSSAVSSSAVSSSEELLSPFDELHLLDGRVIGHRRIGEHAPSSPPGRTFVRHHRLVSRMEFDKGGVSATDLRELWAMATEPHGWLGPPTALILYDGRRRSEESGHDGCQLIATGASGRELWLQLPEPDEYDRVAAGRRRQQYEGAFSEWEAAQQFILRSVGADTHAREDRSLRDTLLGRHRLPPAVVRWP